MRRVMIATPAHDGRVSVHFADSLASSIKLCATSSVDLCPVYWPGEALVQRARDELVKMAIEGQVDDLIFIDEDQAWRPEWILRLLAYPVDVVGGAVVKKAEQEAYNVKASSIVVDRVTGLLIVEALGTGFLRLSRKALQAAWDASPAYTDKGVHCRAVFQVGIVGGELVGEDVSFCAKLSDCGFRVHLDAAMTCDHIGTKKYSGDFARFLKALERKSA